MAKPVLAAAGILFMLLVIVAVIYLIIRIMRPDANRDKRRADALPSEDPLAVLRLRYDALFIMLEVPQNAMIVRLACNNYAASGAALRHYCWLRDDILMLFPLWESFVGSGGALVAPDIQLREWRIPLPDIVCFATEQGLPNKFVVLQFKKEADVLTVAFSEDAARVFSILFPEKDFTHLLEELYPKSSRNIRDIKENFLSLKELREGDLITEDEYSAKKKEMLILM